MEPLTKKEKETIGLLSIGTFLEYFDLMLYVHMAVLLNELFFEKSNSYNEALLAAFAFCSTYFLRPFGALFFGYIGDKIGRKQTVTITTFLMAISCVAMANLPTYAQIGFTASVIVTICRIVQGMSSMGEITGAQLYLSESIPAPRKYPAVAFLPVAISTGTMFALGIAYFVTNYEFNWRYAFWAGGLIALVGATARTRLRETPEFANVKLFLERGFKEENIDKNPAYKKYFDVRAPIKTSLSLLFMDCMWPICFYFTYIHCGLILKNTFAYTADDVIHQNLMVSFVQIGSALMFFFLTFKIHPLRILKWQYLISVPVMLAYPFILDHINSPLQLFFLQAYMVFFAADAAPGTSVFFRYFPVLRRFTSIGLMYAISRAIVYVIISFGSVNLIDWFGNWGILLIILPIVSIYAYGWCHFNKLERKREREESNQMYTIVEAEEETIKFKKNKIKRRGKKPLKNLKERSRKGNLKFISKESTI